MMDNSTPHLNVNKVGQKTRIIRQQNITKYFQRDVNKNVSGKDRMLASYHKAKLYLESLEPDTKYNQPSQTNTSTTERLPPLESSIRISKKLQPSISSPTDRIKNRIKHSPNSLDDRSRVKIRHLKDKNKNLPQYQKVDYIALDDEFETDLDKYCINHEHSTKSDGKVKHGPSCKCKRRHQTDTSSPYSSDNEREMPVKHPSTSFNNGPLYESKIQQVTQYEKDNEPDITKTTSTSIFGKENATPKTRRALNEIRSASMVCPVLIRDPAKEDLRETLNDMGIYRNCLWDFSFNVVLAEMGEDLAKKYVSEEEENSFYTLLRVCMYCGFRSESRLALGHHLDTKHKNKFKN